MFLLNLTIAEFLGLFGAASALVVALYLFDRARRRIHVSTLRFWTEAVQPVSSARRTRIQQPLSLLLQLAGIALLLLAIGQLHIGNRGAVPMDHIVVMETSAWMAARSGGNATLMDRAKDRALAYLKALPSNDRVMLVRADALATPATAFETDRRKVEQAIQVSEPGATALNLNAALDFARQAHALSARRPGEIMFIGSGRVPLRTDTIWSGPELKNLRYDIVPDPVENIGLRRINLKRSPSEPDLWEIFVSVRNYGQKPRENRLELLFGGAPAGAKTIALAPGSDHETSFSYRTAAAGLLEVRLAAHDAFPADDRAVLELPQDKRLRVLVFSADPSGLRPVLESDPRIHAVFRSPAEYSAKPLDTDLIILDRFNPRSAPQIDAVWIDPPRGGPFAVRDRVENARITSWNGSHPLGNGLRATDFQIESTSVFVPGAGDVRVAEVAGGPVIVARPQRPKTLAIGFHPASASVRYTLATPLLFGNAMRWMAPSVFRRWEVAGGSAGVVRMPLDADIQEGSIHVAEEGGGPLPFTLKDRALSYFSGSRGTIRVTAGERELIHSLTLPEVGETRWEPPAGAKRGIPPAAGILSGARNLWPLMALAGAVMLLLEWLLFGRLGHRSALGIVWRRPA